MARFMHAVFTLGCLISSAYPLPASIATRGESLHYQRSNQLSKEQLQAVQPTISGLPSNSNVTLVHSVLGIGVQNYTCNGTAFIQTETGDGAAALLYDTSEFLRRHPSEIDALSQNCNYESCAYPQILNRLLGDHYFSAVHIPTFNLTQARITSVLSGAKDDDIPAPDPTAVDWLFLTANATDGITQNLAEVYRLDTFGGKAPSSCDQDGQALSVPYTAQYWFYR